MEKKVLKNMLISWNGYDKKLILEFSNSLHSILVYHKSWQFPRKINWSDKSVKYFINSRYFTRTKATERLPMILLVLRLAYKSSSNFFTSAKRER